MRGTSDIDSSMDRFQLTGIICSCLVFCVRRFYSEHQTNQSSLRNVKPHTSVSGYVVKIDCENIRLQVLQLNDDGFIPVVTSIAVANLHGSFYEFRMSDISNIIEALECSVVNKPYPPGSRFYGTAWKVAHGISNMCLHPVNARRCVEAGIIRVVENAMEQRPTDSRMTVSALNVLWNISRLDVADSRR